MVTTPSWSLRPKPKVPVVSLTHRARFSVSITSFASTSIFSAIVSSNVRSLEAVPCYIHYMQICGIIGNPKWKNSQLPFGFAGNGLAPPKNKYCYLKATLTFSVMGEQCNMQCSLPHFPRYTSLHVESMGIFIVFSNPLLVSRKTCNGSSEDDLRWNSKYNSMCNISLFVIV